MSPETRQPRDAERTAAIGSGAAVGSGADADSITPHGGSGGAVGSRDASGGPAGTAASKVAAGQAQSKPTPIIKLDDVHVTFRTRTAGKSIRAVRGVSLELMPGETIGIVGESGCGKSTTANIMCGLRKPTAGHVYFQGREVTKRTASDRRAIGRVVSVVFQDPATALNARMAVRDQLADPLHVHKVGSKEEREARVRRLISMVGLPTSALDALPGQLSGGQRQRVAIARALAIKPAAIIADEPTSALDVSVRAQILNLLTDLKEELGLAMVFISHDIQTVRYVSDRIVVMNGGQIIEEGPAATLLADPQDPYTRKLLGAAPSLLHPSIPDELEVERQEIKTSQTA